MEVPLIHPQWSGVDVSKERLDLHWRPSVEEFSIANQPVAAPRLTLKDVQGRALMIHEGGDNYSDEPKPLGGGAGRIACGIVK